MAKKHMKKNAQHHSSSDKWKSTPQAVTSQLSEPSGRQAVTRDVTPDGNVNCFSHYRKQNGGSSKIRKIYFNAGFVFKGNKKRISKGYIHSMFIAAFITIAKIRKQRSVHQWIKG